MARAVWFTDYRQAELRDEEVPPPTNGELQVEAIYSLVSPGSELNLYRGEGNLPDLLLPGARGQLPFPVKFAYQTVGRIVNVAEDSPWKVGDLVFCRHPHQELFNITPGGGIVTKVPEGTDPRSAVFAAMFMTSLNTLLDGPVRPGDVVAVSGLGLIGAFAAHLARLSAGRLVIIDPLLERRERAKWINADAAVGPEDAPAAIEELSEGRGVDLFIEASGAPSALQLAIRTTGETGTITAASWYGTRKVELELSPEFHLRRQRIISSHVGALESNAHPGWTTDRALSTAIGHLRNIPLEQIITHELPFDRAPEAYSLIDTRQSETLGVLLSYDSPSA